VVRSKANIVKSDLICLDRYKRVDYNLQLKVVINMGLPKRRTSKEKQRKRATFYKVKDASATACPNCGEVRLPHRLCPSCGYYNGKEIVKQREE